MTLNLVKGNGMDVADLRVHHLWCKPERQGRYLAGVKERGWGFVSEAQGEKKNKEFIVERERLKKREEETYKAEG